MQAPDFLADDLQPYLAAATTEKELFQALARRPEDLIAFFETACEDEVWLVKHLHFVKSVVRWGAKNFYLGRLPVYEAKRLATIIRLHYSLLEPFLFFQPALFLTITLQIEGEARLVNSLLFGTSSRFFKDLFTTCFNKFVDFWSLSSISLPIFELIEQYVLKGQIGDLWKREEPDILLLMRQAKAWDFPGLAKECAAVLKRYLTPDNVIDTLLQAHRQFFLEWKRVCCEAFNHYGYGLRLLALEHETDLKVEWLDFKQETLDLFNRLAPFVTHLTFSGELSQSPYYGQVIDLCPRLVGIDLSGSAQYDNQFDDMPGSLIELNLSACAWLRPKHLKEVGYQFLNLKKLSLNSNVQLSYEAWGEFSRLRHLIALHLAGCHQLEDEDLKLISRSCSHLLELDLDECRNLTDGGLFDLIAACPQLTQLTISRCQELTDKTLQELGVRAYQLSELNIVRCVKLTDQGLLQLLRLRPTLKSLNVKSCEFSLRTLEKIRHDYPFLELKD